MSSVGLVLNLFVGLSLNPAGAIVANPPKSDLLILRGSTVKPVLHHHFWQAWALHGAGLKVSYVNTRTWLKGHNTQLVQGRILQRWAASGPSSEQWPWFESGTTPECRR